MNSHIAVEEKNDESDSGTKCGGPPVMRLGDIIVGSRGTVEVNPRDAMMREATVKGLMLFAATERELAGIHAALSAGMGNGTVRPVVGEEMPLADAPRAHEAVLAPGAYGKIVLVP